MRIYQYTKASRLTDFFKPEFMEKLGLENRQLEHLSFNRGKIVHLKFVRAVFTNFLKLMVQDCIDNGVKFVGHGSFWFYIWINKMPDWEVDRIAKSGIYKKVNLIKSDFNIYNFVFYSKFLPKTDRYRNVRIGYEKYHEMVDMVNHGKRYSNQPRYRTYHYFMPIMREMYPLLEKRQIAMIIKEGCYRMQKAIVVDRQDVKIRNSRHKFSMIVYKHRSLASIKKRRAKRTNGSN